MEYRIEGAPFLAKLPFPTLLFIMLPPWEEGLEASLAFFPASFGEKRQAYLLSRGKFGFEAVGQVPQRYRIF